MEEARIPHATVIEEGLTILHLAERCAFKVGATARQQSQVPADVMTANARSHSSTLSSSNGFLRSA